MFITIEGVDGSGKTTLISQLAEYLRMSRIDVVTTREPGGSPVAEKLRSVVLGHAMSPRSELLVFTAARIDHCINTIIPAMLEGKWVLCDRFLGSTYACQQCGKGVEPQLIDYMKRMVHHEFAKAQLNTHPSVTHLELILDCDFETSSSRLTARGVHNVLDTRDRDSFNLTRSAYAEYAKANRLVSYVVDASGSVENTLRQSIKGIEMAMRSFIVSHPEAGVDYLASSK